MLPFVVVVVAAVFLLVCRFSFYYTSHMPLDRWDAGAILWRLVGNMYVPRPRPRRLGVSLLSYCIISLLLCHLSGASTSPTTLVLVPEVGILVGIVPHGGKMATTLLCIVLFSTVSLSLFLVSMAPNCSVC